LKCVVKRTHVFEWVVKRKHVFEMDSKKERLFLKWVVKITHVEMGRSI
jgi:hypothetical protein